MPLNDIRRIEDTEEFFEALETSKANRDEKLALILERWEDMSYV